MEFSLGGIFVGGIFVGGIFVGGIFVGGIFVGGIFLEPPKKRTLTLTDFTLKIAMFEKYWQSELLKLHNCDI